jgi:hypothetical protein
MIHLACIFALIAIAVLILLVINLNGATATIFSFIGMPALGLALALYGIERWRAGAFRFGSTSDHTEVDHV